MGIFGRLQAVQALPNLGSVRGFIGLSMESVTRQ